MVNPLHPDAVGQHTGQQRFDRAVSQMHAIF
jgi:hypothetical protein